MTAGRRTGVVFAFALAFAMVTFGGASAIFAFACGCRGLIWWTDAAEEAEL